LRLRRLGEHRCLTFRADFFNAPNHANLNPPDSFLPPESVLGPTSFGKTSRGTIPRETGFPVLLPFTPGARQVQAMVKVEF
jgi:hypothetical protein